MATFFEGYSRNDCEELVRRLYPEVDAALSWLQQFGDARLTGTGASVFASFETETEASAALQQLPDQWTGISAKGLNHSPVTASIVEKA